MKIQMCIFVFLIITASSCSKSKQPKMDLSTPEGAILCLEDAYRRGDIEAAVACKDFWLEAKCMLEDSKFADTFKDGGIDEEIIAKAADTLEKGYRMEMEQNGFPDFNGLRSTFSRKQKVKDNIYKVTEVCYFPDGGNSVQNILVGYRNGQWKVLYPLD